MRKRNFGWGVLAAAIVLLSTPGSEARSKRPRARPFALRAHAVDFSQDAFPTRHARERSFEGYETHTIEFDVYRRGRSGLEAPTQVKLYLPNGDLYGAIDVTSFAPASAANPRRGRGPAATARVRVSNTVITRYGLYGEWHADVCWETGSTTTCGRGVSFEIH